LRDGRTDKKGSKTAKIAPEGVPHAPLRMRPSTLRIRVALDVVPCTPRMEMTKEWCLCNFQVGFCGKILFLLLWPSKQSCTINRDYCTLFYSFRKLVVQDKGQASRASRQRISILLLFSLEYVFLLLCNDVGFHEQLNLLD